MGGLPSLVRPALDDLQSLSEAHQMPLMRGELPKDQGRPQQQIHAIADKDRSLSVLILAPGNAAGCVMAQECVGLIPSRPLLAKPASPGIKKLLAGPFGKSSGGYDTDAVRAFLKDHKIKPVIPGKSNRKKKIRHAVERCFGRLKDFRRIATRYGKLAQNYFSALCSAATLAYWI